MTVSSGTRLSGPVAVTPRPLPAYRDMFLITDAELTAGPILDCPSGASPFGAQVRALGGEVVSVDPAYGEPDVAARAHADADRITAWQRTAPAGFNWTYLGSPEAMHAEWTAAVTEFAADFARDDRRYVAATLPRLPFPDGHFALALSGFLLFVYPELIDPGPALLELVRVTRGEVRAYPLCDTAGEPYAGLPALRSELAASGVHTAIRETGTAWSPVPGGDRMLVCRKG